MREKSPWVQAALWLTIGSFAAIVVSAVASPEIFRRKP
jgi:hypothetical protein